MRNLWIVCAAVLAAGIFLNACSHQADPAIDAASALSPSEFELGQPRSFFIAKWGPASARNTWKVGEMTASVQFLDGQAAIISYTLATKQWTDEQVAAALEANGSGWERVSNPPGNTSSEFGSAILEAMGGSIPKRYMSVEGTEARLFATTMTLKSVAQLQREQDEQAAAIRRRQAVPNF